MSEKKGWGERGCAPGTESGNRHGIKRPAARRPCGPGEKTGRASGAGYVLTALCLCLAGAFLTGCSARELESRAFPLALEVGALDGEVVLACAWPGTGDENAQEGGQSGAMIEEKETEEKETEGQDGILGEDTEGQPAETLEEAGAWSFPVNNNSMTAVRAPSIQEAARQVQNLQDKYVDYSQVKAILWDVSLRDEAGLKEEILAWLEEDPAFARNILIFQVSSQELTLENVQERGQGQAGTYLENLYRNNPGFQENVRTLEEVLYLPERKR